MKSIYLVAYYYQKPKARVKTTKPGWKNNSENISWDEQVTVTRVLKNRDLTMAKVILDLVNRRVVRNAWSPDRDFDELYRYFEKGYPEQTTTVMKQIEAVKPKSISELPTRIIDTSGSISSI